MSTNYPWTGCNHDGTEQIGGGNRSRGLGSSSVRVGNPNSSSSGSGPLSSIAMRVSTQTRPMYGLSAVFQVAAAVVVPNNPPAVATAIPDQSATAGTAFSYAFPDTTFSDADTGDTLSYTATKADDTALPTWLAFAASTRTFSGTPQAADIATVSVKVTASDGNGGSVSDEFDITVAADPNAHCNALDTSELWCGTLTVGVGGGVTYGYYASLSFGSVAPLTFTHGGATITVNRLVYASNRLQFLTSSALGAGDFSLEIGTGGAKRSFAMNNPGMQADFFNHGLSWSANETVPVKLLLVNTPATGAPAITGTAQVGQTLTATLGDIADVDGLPDPFLTDANTSFQWIRVATDNSETDISGAMAGAYTLVADDQGTTIKVKVSFTGNNGFAETLTSAATAAVSANNPPTSSNKNLALNEDTELTFLASDFPFTDADGNSLSSVKILSLPATDKGTLTFSGMALTSGDLPQTVPAAQLNSLKYVPPANENGGNIPFTSFTFRVNDGTDDSAATYTLTFLVYRVNDAATGQPGITGTAQVGQTLAATAGTIADVDGLPDPFLTDTNTSFQWVRVTSGTDADISGARDSTYTLVADDEGKKIKVKVSFLDTEASTNQTEGPLTSAATATVAASTNTPATGTPTITGTAQVGQTLTAGTTAIMDADGLTSVSYTYQWIRTAAGVDTNISGATASTYTLVAADLGTTIKVRVSFTDDASNAETLTSAATAAVSAAANTPATGAPTITGTAQVGQVLTATVGTIADVDGLPDPFFSDAATTIAWIRVATDNTDTNISGATASTYTLVAADLGTTIKVTVSFTDDASNAETLTSAATAAVSAAPNTPATGAPTITGTAQVGQTLTATVGDIADVDGLPDPFLTDVNTSFQWIRVATDNTETNISGATASTYTLVAADLGTTIKVRVSFTDDASNAETLTSAATAAVSAAANNLATGAPTITGTAQVGQTLTATVGTIADVDGLPDPFFSDAATTIAWIRVATDNSETNIASATASTYTLVAADQGTTIKVKVSFTDDATNPETLTSAATAAVSAAPNTPATGAPTITGTAQVGQTLTAGTTAIMDADGLTSVSYTYQWIRVATDNTDTNISGATASTHTLVAADQGTTIKVTVSFTDDASNAETLTSAATAVVSAAPNTLPSASDGTVTTNEDTARTFAAADFNFLDTDPGDTLESVEIITLPASGTGTLALSGTPVTAGQEIAEADIGTLTYTPPANANGTGYASFTFKVSDGTAESAADYTMTITVTAVNDAPTVATAIPDQPATAGTAFSYAFPANTFSDADIGDTLTYAATKADGATLPAWLSFAAGTRTFSGTPQAADIGTVAVKVTASDGNGGSVSDTFDITVSAAGDTTPPTLTSATVFEGGVFINLQFSENMLQSNLPSTDTFTVTAAGSAVTVYTVLPAVFPVAPPNAFWILVRPTIQQGQVVVVTYTDPTADDDANAIQNTAGNDAATFTTGMDGVPAVTNNSITNTPATGAPTITGTATVGQTLTAVTTGIMDADGLNSVSYMYQWIRVDGTDADISGATSITYTLVGADLGKTIKVRVSFTDDASNPETLTSAATAAVSAAANTPATGAPAITGAAQVGQVLTATVGTIADVDGLPDPFFSDAATTIAWIRVATDNSETNIASATASTYTLVDADLGTTIKVRVSFTDDASNPETLTSAATAAVSAAANTPATGAPTITGTAQVGQTLTAGTTAIVDADGLTSVSYTYQWIRVDGDTETNIASATASTYTLVAADLGTTIKVTVSFTDDASNAETLTSAATAAVSAAANNLATGAPTITGTAQVGQTLTAGTTAIMDADGLTNVSYTYQWIRVDGGTETNISGATSITYTLVGADLGKTIKVKVSFTDDASNPETLTSTATAVVSAAPNTLPSASDGTVTTNEDTARTFAAADFNFLDTDPGDTLSNVRIVTLPASGKGTLALSGTPVTANQVVAATNIGTLTYTPPANANGTGYASFTFKVSDGTAESAADYTMTITVTAVNDAPTVATAIPDQPATAGTAFSYAFPANTFSDADIGDTLTYAATKADGATLPAWLSFAAGTRTFSGTPQAADIGTVAVKVTASDGNGGSVSDTFDITVSAAGDTTPPTLTSATVFEGGVFINLQFSENMLQSNLPSTDTFTVTAAGSAVTVYTVLPAVFPVAPPNAFWILVRPTIQQGQVVVVTYTDPTADDDANAIQNTAGNDAATFTTGMDGVPAVTNNSITNTPATGAPTITGTAQVGQTLTAGTTAIMDADGLTTVQAIGLYKFQWIRVATDNSETNIASATTTYTLVAADLGTTIKVTVSFTDDASNAETLTSAATAVVSAAPNTPATGAPTITGTAQVGQTLTAGTTAIVDADGLTSVSYTYQWIRVATDNTETNISGATASTHTLVAADQGTTIKVKVSFTDDASNPETLTSAATAVVTATTGQTTVTFGASSYTATEGGAAATVTVALSAAPSASVTIPLTTAHLNGATAADHAGIPATVTFGTNQTVMTFTVTATDDADTDGGESVQLGFGTLPAGYAPGARRTATVTLVDDDANLIVNFGTERHTTVKVLESDTVWHRFIFSLSTSRYGPPNGNPQQPVTIPLVVTHVGGAKAEEDYEGIPKSVTFEVGQSVTDFSMRAIPDGKRETGEGLRLDFGPLPAGVRKGTWGPYETIAFVDQVLPGYTVLFGAEAYTATEGGAPARVSIHLSEPVEIEPLVVGLVVTHVGATAADYTGIPKSVRFGVGEQTQTITVTATDDTDDDDGESVTLSFVNDPNGRVRVGTGPASATVALADNDGTRRVTVSFGAVTYTATEGGADATVRVELDAAPGRSVTVPLTKAHLGNATAADYSGIPMNVTFAANQTSRTFAVMATAGDGSDGGESVSIGFGTLPEGVFAGSPAATTVTLADGGEQRLVVNFGSSRGHTVQVREGARRLRLNVLLDSSPRRPVTIPLVVTHVGGATEADYAAIPESVTFAAGQTSAHYYVRALPDEEDKTGEGLQLDFGPLPPGVRKGTWGPYETIDFLDPDPTALLPAFAAFRLLTSGNASAQDSVESDRAVLVALYNATDGPNWTGNTHWLSNEPLSEWRGVGVNDDGRVTALWLFGNRLTGEIPVELSQLSQLQLLYLSSNQLTGEIPVELSQLSQLQDLSLDSNQLTGEIPVELSQLSQLQLLYLSSNRLTGEIPAELGDLAQLNGLYLHGNELNGPIPSWLVNLTELRELSLWSNRLTGTIPPEVAPAQDRAALVVLYLQTDGPNWTDNTNWARSREPLSEWHGVSTDEQGRVEELRLSANGLNGTIGAELGVLTRLTGLYLNDNELTGTIPPELENLTQLQVFDIRNTGLCVTADSELHTWIATIQDFQGTATCGASNLVANFVNGNNGAFNSRVYLWNPSESSGDVTVRVFTLPLTGGLAQELTAAPLNLGTLGAKSALNVKVAEDILAPLGITLPYTNNEGDLTLEFTIQAVDVRGATQVFSSSLAFGTHPLQEIPSTSSGSPTVLVANFMNGNSDAFSSRAYLFNPSDSDGTVTVRVFTLPLSDGIAQELTGTPLDLGTLEARSALNLKLAEDILTPLGITTPYTTDGGNLTLEFTIEVADVRGAAQVFSSSFAFGVYPLQEIPSTSSGSPTVLVANFMNGNSDAFSSRAYLFNPSDSDGTVTVRVFTLPFSDGTAQELTGTPLDLGTLGARSALNLKLVEDILIPLGIALPYTTDGGNLTLEFTIQAADARGVAQVFSSDFAFGTYPMQEIPSTSSESPTVLVANFMNGNDAALNSRVYLWNPSLSAGSVTVRVFTLPLTAGVAQELTTAPLDLGTLGAESARNLKLVEDILTPLGIPTPYVTDGGNLTLEFTIQAADVRGAAQVFSSSFAFGTVPLQVIQ